MTVCSSAGGPEPDQVQVWGLEKRASELEHTEQWHPYLLVGHIFLMSSLTSP
jgi:hypothetical protein